MSPAWSSPSAQTPAVELRIDRMTVESAHDVDAFALRLALADAVRDVIADRGVPAAWLNGDVQRDGIVVEGFAWDGRGGEPGLARALVAVLFAGGPSGGVLP